MLLAHEDPAKVARASKANSIAYQPALEKIAGFDINWNIVAYPTESWAKRVFPSDEADIAVGRLAEAISRRRGSTTTIRSRLGPPTILR